MTRWIGFPIIWAIAVRDCILTDYFICETGLASEANPIALLVIENLGTGALPLLRLLGTAIFTIALAIAYRKRSRLAPFAYWTGILSSVALNVWWDYCLVQIVSATA